MKERFIAKLMEIREVCFNNKQSLLISGVFIYTVLIGRALLSNDDISDRIVSVFTSALILTLVFYKLAEIRYRVKNLNPVIQHVKDLVKNGH